MLELTPDNALDYLYARGALPGDVAATAELLGWGVSNVVLRIAADNGTELVVKQSREKLRTQADWRSRLERIYREAEVQQHLAGLLPGMVPPVLFEDRENYLFAMQAVEADHIVWKEALLKGRADESVALTAAAALACVHSRTASDEGLRKLWSDTTVFDELRLDPYYRFVAKTQPAVAGRLRALIDETLATRVCLVLGDFSPKNILLTRRGISLVDFETGHYGDPAFDLGFFLSHLLLKAIFATSQGFRKSPGMLDLAEAFWGEYLARLEAEVTRDEMGPWELSRRTVSHLAGCLLARIDGKSPVDYLDDRGRNTARQFALRLFLDAPWRVESVFEQMRTGLAR